MQKTGTHVPSLLATILFALSGLLLLGIGLSIGFAVLFSVAAQEPIQAPQTIFLLAFIFEAILVFVIAFFALQKALQKASADQILSMSVSPLQILVGVFLAVGAILIGSFISGTAPFNWLLLPILTLPGVVLPLCVLLALGTQRLPFTRRWQVWSVLGLGMTLTPFLLLLLEAVTAILLFIGVAVYVTAQPELANELQGLARQIMILGPQSEATLDLLSPFLTRPGVIFTALLYIAVIVPAIEELLKPLGVWLLAGKLDSTAQGFTLGALSGAGYALIETIGVIGQTNDWAVLLFTRIGTGLLHITTSALMGAAIVLAWRERRYLRLLGTYLFVILLHGLWNACAMLFTFSTLAESLNQPSRLVNFQPWLIATMSLLAVGLLSLLLIYNRRMRREIIELPVPLPTMDENQTNNFQ